MKPKLTAKKETELIRQWENSKKVAGLMLDMQKSCGGFVMKPIILGQVFLHYLQENQPNGNNIETARGLAEVFSLMCHIYRRGAKRFNFITSFFISPSIWHEHLIGRRVQERSIAILREMGLVENYNWYPDGKPNHRRKWYRINLEKLQEIISQAQSLRAEARQRIRDRKIEKELE